MACQCRFSCNKYTTLVGDADNGGGYTRVGAGSIWQISVPINFAVNLKLKQTKNPKNNQTKILRKKKKKMHNIGK